MSDTISKHIRCYTYSIIILKYIKSNVELNSATNYLDTYETKTKQIISRNTGGQKKMYCPEPTSPIVGSSAL